jgi:hypothetical protein
MKTSTLLTYAALAGAAYYAKKKSDEDRPVKRNPDLIAYKDGDPEKEEIGLSS